MDTFVKHTEISPQEEMAYDAVLKDWGFILYPVQRFVLIGAIYDDKKKRWIDGSVVRTSVVKEVFVTKGVSPYEYQYVRTRNSVYKLS